MGAAQGATCVRGDSGTHEGGQAWEAAHRRSVAERPACTHLHVIFKGDWHATSHFAWLLVDRRAGSVGRVTFIDTTIAGHGKHNSSS